MTTAENLGQDGRSYYRLMRRWSGTGINCCRTSSARCISRNTVSIGRFGLTQAKPRLRDIQKLQNMKAGRCLPGLRRTPKCRWINPAALLSDYCWGRQDTPSAGRWRKADHSRLPKLAKDFVEMGGEVGDRPEVHSLVELPKSKIVLLDITQKQLGAIAGTRLRENNKKKLSDTAMVRAYLKWTGCWTVRFPGKHRIA